MCTHPQDLTVGSVTPTVYNQWTDESYQITLSHQNNLILSSTIQSVSNIRQWSSTSHWWSVESLSHHLLHWREWHCSGQSSSCITEPTQISMLSTANSCIFVINFFSVIKTATINHSIPIVNLTLRLWIYVNLTLRSNGSYSCKTKES